MNLRQMEVFHAIMVSGTVTGAAEILNVSQPSVTGMLRHTEDQLGFKLFDRIKGRLRTTPEAHAIMSQIENVFDRVEVVSRTIDSLRQARSGTLDIVAIPVVGTTLLPAAIGAFLKDRPDIAVRFHVRMRREVMQLVASGAVDLGFGFLSGEYPNLKATKIAARDLVCIMPKNHPLARLAVVPVRELASHRLITYTSNQGLAPAVNAMLTEAGIDSRSAIEVGLIINAWAMVDAGTGVAIVDDLSALKSLFGNVVVRPLDRKASIALEAFMPESHPPSLLAQAFLAHCAKYVTALVPEN